MVLGTIALLTLLFSTGSFELFFIHDFENGVKEIIIDKDRKKDILTDIKQSEKTFKDFNKQRQSDLKQFKKLNVTKATTSDQFIEFFSEVETQRLAIQSKLIDSRIKINKKIEPQEWDSIVAFSKSNLEEESVANQKKEEKKKGKNAVESFAQTQETISKMITSSENKENILKGLAQLKGKMNELQNTIDDLILNSSSLFTQKEASKTELLEFNKRMNNTRSLLYQELVSFHGVMSKNSNDAEWKKIIKSFNKDLELLTK
jgi:glycerophosphoryl diester phosphodiesterase